MKTLLSLFTIYEISFSQITGPNGQNCTFGIDDNPPDACPVNGGSFTSLTGEEIECEENFDCCLCASITCGAADGSSVCEKFSGNGDNSIFFVDPITIYGDLDDGTEIDCNGDDSCPGTGITATGIKDIKCSGDGSCSGGNWDISCIADDGCSVDCTGNFACQELDIIATNINELKCGGRRGCYNGTFSLSCIGDGDACNIECDSDEACTGATITLDNVEQVVCGAVDSCKDATIIVTDPVNEFELQCKSPGACQGATIIVNVTAASKVKEFKGISCESDAACDGATITVINNGQKDIEIEELDCEDAGACTGATFSFDSGSRAVTIEECKCGDSGGCLGATGIDQCQQSLEKLECKDNLCRDTTIVITNPAKEFEIICDDEKACKGLDLTVIVNDDARKPIKKFKGIKCGDRKSCNEATISIDNQQSGTTLEIEEIECGGKKSCKTATFSFQNVDFPEIDCEGSNSCDGCTVNSVPCKGSSGGNGGSLTNIFAALSGGNDADNLAMNENSENGEQHNVTIELSPFLLGNVWAVVVLFAAVYVTLIICCYRRGNKEVIVESV